MESADGQSPQLPASLCGRDGHFCPVSFRKYGFWFWGGMLLVSIAAIVLNVWLRQPALLTLYSFPVSYLAMAIIPLPLSAAGLVILLGTLPLYSGNTPFLWGVIAGLAVFYLVVKRVVHISSRNYQHNRSNEETLLNTVLTFAKTIDARDPYTAFHSHNVANYARRIAEEMKLPKAQTDAIYLAGLIHDIGKIGTPEAILQKESRLTDEEYDIMKKHPDNGHRIVKDMTALAALDIPGMVRHHHERLDGRGYPDGLAGEAIPLGARILCVADSFDAMTTNRSYRAKLAFSTAADELERHSGAQFDPQAARALLQVLRRDGQLPREGGFELGSERAVVPAAANS
jgi:putative nucleotidyltransferase with HDIG domain